MSVDIAVHKGNGHADCQHCHGTSLFWRPSGEAALCTRCRSCCECTCGEPLSEIALTCTYCRSDDGACYCSELAN